MDGFNVSPTSCLDEVIREIVMLQTKICVTEVVCECGQVHRVPLDGYRICQCGQKVVSQALTELTDRVAG
jgi:hypothetical protein